MSATPEWLADRVRAYYLATTEPGYLASWAGDALGFHFGFADEHTASHDESLLNVNRYLADRARVTPGARVLDAGCGVGGSALWLARERGAEVVGVTLAPNQVDLARRFAQERGLADRVSFLCMDFADTSFPEASFDVIWHVESLCHLADPRAYLDHALRLLRPGGRFACLDLFLGDGGDPDHARAMCEGWVLPSLLRLSELGDALREAGFAQVETEDVTARTLRSAARLEQMSMNRAVALGLRKLSGARNNPVYEGHTLAAIGAAQGLRGGAVTYGYAGAVKPT